MRTETSGPQFVSRTAFTYDDVGRLIEVEDALSRTTEYEYNSRDWITVVTLPDPDGSGSATSPTYSRTYDAAGRLLTETDPLNQTTTFAYDDVGRVLTVTV